MLFLSTRCCAVATTPSTIPSATGTIARRRCLMSPCLSSLELELGTEFEHAPAHNLYRVLPRVIRRAVPGLLVEDSAGVEGVIDVEIRPQPPGPAQREDPAGAKV